MSSTSSRPAVSRAAPHPARASARGVVVLGMGRSGTSAVTGMFERSGYFVGADPDLLPPDESNPTGYFEHWSVYRANEQVLARLDGTWFDVPEEIERYARDPTCTAPLKHVLTELLSAAGHSPLALKDPRIGVMLAIWWPLLESVLHPVLVVRDPLEIARSLERRDGTALPVALAMWEVHVTRLLAAIDGRRVTVIPYLQALEVPGLAGRLVAEASAELLPELRRSVDPAAAGSALEPSLRRNATDESTAARSLTRRQERLWGLLASLAPGTTVVRAPSWATEVGEETRRLTAYERRRQRASKELVDRIAQAGAALAERDRRLAEQDAAAAEQAAALADMSTRNDTLDRALAEQERRLVEASRRAVELESQLASLSARHDETSRRLRAADHWLAEIQGSLSWRATKSLRALKRVRRRR